MMQEQEQGWCYTCQQMRLFTRSRYEVPHLGHLLMSIVTMGFWLPVWGLHMACNVWSSEPFRCAHCGTDLRQPRVIPPPSVQPSPVGRVLRQWTRKVVARVSRDKSPCDVGRGDVV